MSPAAPPSPLTVLTSPDPTSPWATLTPVTFVALILLFLLTAVVFGTLLVFTLRRRLRTPTSTQNRESNFLDLEAGRKKSPFFEVSDPSVRSSTSVRSRVAAFFGLGSKSQAAAEPELPWPVYTAQPHMRLKEPFHLRMLSWLGCSRKKGKREPLTAADVQRAMEDVEAQAPMTPAPVCMPIWTRTWRTVLSLFQRKLPEIVIHPCDGSPAFPYLEDLDSTPASCRERRLLARCEDIVSLAAVDLDFCSGSASPEPKPPVPASFISLTDTSGSLCQDYDPSDLSEIPMRPSTPLGTVLADKSASITDVSAVLYHNIPSAAPSVGLGIEVLVSQFPQPQGSEGESIFSSSSESSTPEQSTLSNSSSENSVADIISVLEEIATDSSSSSDSLSLRTIPSDESITLRPSGRKRFSGVFEAIKRVSLQSLDLTLDLEAIADVEGGFGRSTYYGVLGEYGGGRDSVTSVETF